ncbi:MAG: GNAT family N-acetyltransferase [Planctomycetota bacterium]
MSAPVSSPRSEPALPPFDPQPVVLAGRHVRLAPLAEAHAEDLLVAGRDPAVWRYLAVPPPDTLAATRAWIRAALAAAAGGSQLPFTVIPTATGHPGGSTRFIDIRRADRGLEIGWTWIAPAIQRTGVNTEAKLLLLTHAFETLGAIRVQLKTDLRNERSQAAIARLGAQREGILRRHVICWDGYLRDTVMFSITREEWPAVRAKLTERLAQGDRER